MKALCWSTLAIELLLIVIAIACGLAGIWTQDPRWTDTASLLAGVALLGIIPSIAALVVVTDE